MPVPVPVPLPDLILARAQAEAQARLRKRVMQHTPLDLPPPQKKDVNDEVADCFCK